MLRVVFVFSFCIFLSYTSYSKAVYEPARASFFVLELINKINSGDKDILRTISYRELNFALDYKRSYDNLNKINFFKRRPKVVNAALKGLFNKDPRVRLICIEILNLMQVDRLMEPEVSLAYRRQTSLLYSSKRKLSKEYKDYYVFVSLFGKKLRKSVTLELTKLYKFVLRDKFLFYMLKRDPNFLSSITKEDFLILYEPIAGESEDKIPFRSFKNDSIISADNLRVIVNGLKNPNLSVRRYCSYFLINYYNYNANYLDQYYRNIILNALKKAYKDNIIRKPSLVKVRR